jgi:hypothetical protein
MNHIPYNRQSKEFALSSINISRDLMCNYTIYASDEAMAMRINNLLFFKIFFLLDFIFNRSRSWLLQN